MDRAYGSLCTGNLRWCRRQGVQPHDASEISQMVFTKVWQNLDSFRKEHSGDTFRGWLWTITKNAIWDLRRRCSRITCATGGTDAYERLERIEQPGDTSHVELGGELIRRALVLVEQEFPAMALEAFCKWLFEQRELAQIASELGVQPARVRQWKSRILRRLRDVIGED